MTVVEFVAAAPVSFQVLGLPAPQGSKRAVNHGGRAVLLDAGSDVGAERTREWRQAVGWAARKAFVGLPPLDGCLELKVRFVMPRPKGAKRDAYWQNKKPDASKLVRATEDALTDAGAITDDARIARIVAEKVLADPTDPWTGALIVLRQLDPRGAA